MRVPFGEISCQVNYFPTALCYKGGGYPDREYAGILVDLDAGNEWMVFPFIIALNGGVTWMNGDYARAHYGVEYPTADLATFDAEMGMRDICIIEKIYEAAEIGKTVNLKDIPKVLHKV